MSLRVRAAIAGAAVALTLTVSATSTQAAEDSAGGLLVGVRSTSYSDAKEKLGPVEVTRQYYDNLPSRYREKYSGTRVIISFRRSSPANTAQYVRSIPAGEPVELVYHHEPEGSHGDYPGAPAQAGAQFVKEFNEQAQVIHANSNVPVSFVGGGYQYRPGGRGIGGHFIPTTADYYYVDSYQQNAELRPATQDQNIMNFRAELSKKGKRFGGFSEYARGTASANPTARVNVLKADNAWLRSIGARVWVYWWAYGPQNDHNYKFTDAASFTAWKQIAAQ
jgi:hypothetical protein